MDIERIETQIAQVWQMMNKRETEHVLVVEGKLNIEQMDETLAKLGLETDTLAMMIYAYLYERRVANKRNSPLPLFLNGGVNKNRGVDKQSESTA